MKIIYASFIGLSILIGQFCVVTAQINYGQRLLGQRVGQRTFGRDFYGRSNGPHVSAFETMLPLNYHRPYGYYDRVIRYYDCDCPFYGFSPYYNCECYSCGCP